MFDLRKIEKADLDRLEPLLRASFGEGFDLKDELEYFSQMPHSSWFYLGGHQPAGFIRCFNVQDELYSVELFVAPSPQRSKWTEALIHHFSERNQLPSNAQIRFEVGESNADLLNLLAKLFPSTRVERFLYMRKALPYYANAPDRCQPSGEAFFVTLKGILEVLKLYSVDTLESLYTDGKLYVHCEDDIPVAALQLEPHAQGACEIIVLTTDPMRLRKGHATKLLQKTLQGASLHFSEMRLKVNEKNIAALNLYKKLGFQTISDKHEQWWYTFINLNRPEI